MKNKMFIAILIGLFSLSSYSDYVYQSNQQEPLFKLKGAYNSVCPKTLIFD